MEAHDKFLYEISKEEQTDEKIFENHQWIFANDNNNNNYSTNQISFDLSSFYNASSLVDWRSAYIQIPVVSVVDITSSSTANDHPNIYALKNGYCNLINSIQVECSNTTVNQISNNINYYNHFKTYTTKSQDYMNSIGPTQGYFGMDSHNSWRFKKEAYNGGVGANNIGSSNNMVGYDQSSVIGTSVQGFKGGNESLFNRIRSYARPQDDNAADTKLSNGTKDLISLSKLKNLGQDYTERELVAGNNYTQVYYNTVIIRLGDIAPFFDSLNLARCYVRLLINLNVGSFVYNLAAGVIQSIDTASFSYNTCPFNLSSFDDNNNPLTNVTKVSAQIGISSVASTLSPNKKFSHNFTACRVYVPQILMNAQYEKIYRMNNTQKMIIWKDVFSTSLLNQGQGQVNYVVSNGLSRLTGVLLVPMISASSNKVSFTNVNFTSPQSPFGSEPSTTSPLMSLSNINVFLAGRAILPQNLMYNFNVFDQMIGVNSLNGGGIISGDLCSGAIDYAKWSNNYRYFYLDANRRNESDNSPKSITVQFTNDNSVNIDIFIFCIFERQAMLDVVTGQLEML